MGESLFSPLWYRVSELHPRLRAGVRVQRQVYRGETWYLLIDGASGRQHRINRSAHELIGRFDGRTSVNRVWTLLLERFGDQAPTQEEVVRILSRLSEGELVQFETTPDIAGLFRERAVRARSRRAWVNPLALSIPFFDPSRLLDRLGPALRPLLHPATLVLWVVAVLVAAVAAGTHWGALQEHAAKYMATTYYLTLAWFCYPVIKALHELAHAVAVRRGGGEVHEMGITLLFFTPVPYVDASAANAFRDRWHRAAVSAAGIMVELGLAAVALFVWLKIEPGLARDLAFVTLFLCAASSLLFNANPLLRFDGYHLLCDLLDLPNLAVRSQAYWMQQVQRLLGGTQQAPAPELMRGEHKWLIFYAPASLVFRLFFALALIFWLGSKWAWLGWLASALVLAYMIARPVWIAIRSLLASLPLRRSRRRAAIILALAGGALGLVVAAPMPSTLLVQGVVWPSEQAQVRAETDGFVLRVLAHDGQAVRPGTPLVELDLPALRTEHEVMRMRVQALQARRFHLLLSDPAQAVNAIEALGDAQAELERVEERLGHLTVRSKEAGQLVLPHSEDLPGAFVQKGATLGYILSSAPTTIRAVVPNESASLLRASSRSAEVMLPGRGSPTPARLQREAPAAAALPSAALGERGGGRYVTDPADKLGTRTLEPVFLFDLELQGETLRSVGQRAWVRFDLGLEPLAAQWYRRLRQLFLKHFNPVA